MCFWGKQDRRIPGYRGQRGSTPLVAPKDKAVDLPHFLPYDGLRIASDEVLGKLFLKERIG